MLPKIKHTIFHISIGAPYFVFLPDKAKFTKQVLIYIFQKIWSTKIFIISRSMWNNSNVV